MEQGDDDTYPAVSHRMAQGDGPAGDNGGDQPGDQFQQENETSSACQDHQWTNKQYYTHVLKKIMTKMAFET